jgi:hypothetical protein
MSKIDGKPKNYNTNYVPNSFHRMPQDLKVGQEVFGEYFGALFAGTITYRQVTDAYNTNYFIKLSMPIFTGLDVAETICFSSNIRDEHSNQLPNHWIKGV